MLQQEQKRPSVPFYGSLRDCIAVASCSSSQNCRRKEEKTRTNFPVVRVRSKLFRIRLLLFGFETLQPVLGNLSRFRVFVILDDALQRLPGIGALTEPHFGCGLR